MGVRRKSFWSLAKMAGLGFATLWVGSASTAYALSSGCSALDGTLHTVGGGPNAIISDYFDAGEVITIQNAGGTFAFDLKLDGNIVDSTSALGKIVTTTIPSTGFYNITVDYAGGTACSGVNQCPATCTKPSSDESTPSSSPALEINRNAVTGTANKISSQAAKITKNLVFGRVRKFSNNRLTTNSAGTQTGLLGLSSGGGAAGGEEAPKFGVWADLGFTGFRDSAAVTASDGGVWTGMIGLDYAVSPNVMVGLAGSIESSSADINSGQRGEFEQQGIGLTPYLAVRITDIFSASLLAGYSWNDGEVEIGTGRGRPDNERWMIGGDFAANMMAGNFTFGSSLGLFYTATHQDSYSIDYGNIVQSIGETTSELGSVSTKLQLGYLMELDRDSRSWLEPYIRFQYDYDFASTQIAGHPNDKDAYTLGGGFNAYTADNLSFDAGASTELGREAYSAISANITARLQF